MVVLAMRLSPSLFYSFNKIYLSKIGPGMLTFQRSHHPCCLFIIITLFFKKNVDATTAMAERTYDKRQVAPLDGNEGWFQGTVVRTGLSGSIPATYVNMIGTLDSDIAVVSSTLSSSNNYNSSDLGSPNANINADAGVGAVDVGVDGDVDDGGDGNIDDESRDTVGLSHDLRVPATIGGAPKSPKPGPYHTNILLPKP